MQGKLRQEELEYWLRSAFLAGLGSVGGIQDEAAGHRAERVAAKLAKEWMASHEN
jgi:hypothetical protein